MSKRRKIVYLIFSLLIWLGLGVRAYSQISIGTPSLGFTQACASSSFNTYNISFSVAPIANLGAGNQFIVELSNAAGAFTAPVTVATLPTATSTLVTGSFAMPTNVYGEAYRIRVRSTVPAKTSGSSVAFPAYYAIHNQPFSINNNVGTVNICSGNTYNLAIDNTGTPLSPLYYPQLTYKWYKDFIEIPGQTGASITVSQPGSYYAVTNYGSCVMMSQSNTVTVSIQSILTPQITTTGGNTICAGATKTLTSDVTNSSFTYTWYRNNIVISGATLPTYGATLDGIYHLVITGGGCVFVTNDLELDLIDFNLDADPAVPTVIIPGQSLTLTGINDAVSPTYQWYRNNVAISGATQMTYNATLKGTYKVSVNEPTPCNTTKEATVVVNYPDSFNLAIQTAAGYQSCVSTSATLNISVFDAVIGAATTNLIGNTYGYSYQWYKGGVAVAGATATQLIVNSAVNNGSYTLQVTIPDFGVVTSNAIVVNLAIANATITGPTSICEGAIAALTSSVNDSAYTYQWYRNNVLIPAITTPTLAVDSAGDYYVKITGGSCTTQSNTITVTVTGINVSSSNPATDTIIPGQTKTLTVTTNAVGPQYVWYRNNVAIAGAIAATYTATQDGTYKVVVTQTVGCNATDESIFVLSYPTGFTLAITANTGYTACTSTTATLSISSFTAQTPSGNVNVAAMGYTYQWYRNNIAVAGATSSTLLLNSSSQNGTYKLVATIPNVGPVSSNDIVINLAMETITVSGNSVFCTGSTVVLSASVNNPGYTYQWYKNGSILPGETAATLTTNTVGDYHVVVTGGTCTTQSPVFALQEATITINLNVTATDVILPGQPKTITVTTNAASPAFVWYRNNILLAETTGTFNATLDGTYKVVVTQTSGCTATAESIFVLNYPSGFNLAAAADAGYTACSSTIITLSLTTFTATTPSGNVNVANVGYAYQWYRNNVAVAGATSASLIVSSASQNGTYRLEATVPSFGVIVSNNIDVNLAIEAVVITNAGGLCEGSTVAITSNVNNAGYTYQWYKDGIAMAGETTSSLTANAGGNYYLRVTGGTCNTQSNTINLVVSGITVSTTNPATDVIMPGQTKLLSVTTDAVAPTYVWYRNNVVIVGATSATYTATQDGTYKVVVTQTSGCAATKEKIFTLVYPTSFNITIAANSAYVPCVSNSVTLSITSFTAVTPTGTVNIAPSLYQYQWYKGATPVAGATAPTLFLNSAAQNGTYKVVVTVPDYTPVNSNTVDVNIAIPVNGVTIVKSGALCEGSSVTLSSNINDAAYTYQWYKDGIAVTGVNAPVLTANTEGDYHLIVTAGTCTSQSNTLHLTVSGITVSSTNPDVDTILPGQTKTLTVTTDAVLPVYAWYRNNILLSETSATLSATEDGEYKVVVTQTAGCAAVEEKIFTLQYPQGFQITIVADGTYTACTSTAATLLIASFTAQTPTGNINVTVPGYQYQWYKDDIAIAGETSTTLSLSGVTDNGEYKLQVTIPQFAPVFSNTVVIKLAGDPVVITAGGVLCEGSTVQLTSSTTNPSYTYQWYKNGVAEAGASMPVYTASAAGSYYLTVTHDGCTAQSNTLALQIAVITINSTSPATDIILPGQTKTITVTTDAIAPTYTWFRNNVQLTETSATLTATQNGTYKVVVTQTSGCNATQEKIFVLDYPTGFEITVANDPSYVACTSTSVTLNVSNFVALTPNGAINVASMGYQYQWYKGNDAVAGATASTLTLNSPSQNGVYRVEVTIPEFAPVVSNSITVTLGVGAVSITSTGLLCDTGSQVVINSSINDASFTYAWYKNGVEVSSGTNPVYTTTEPGSYYVKVITAGCTATSNTLVIEQSTFNLTATTPIEDLIIPGETKTLSVTTDAQQPTFVWYRNGIVIAGQTTSSITATLAGEYKVEVTQNLGCIITKELLFDLVNPSGFALTIAYQNYQSCVSTEVNLFISEFKAVTDEGIIDLIENDFDYDYQWYKDGGIIPGATNIAYLATETGIYTLEVNIPGFGIVTSNGIAVELAFVESVTISTDDIFCIDGTEVTIYSDVTNHEYLYAWYHNNANLVTGADSSITVSEMGTYHLEVIYNGCTIRSNDLVLEPFDVEQIVIDVPHNVDLPEGTSIIVTASGADNFTWYHNDDEISTENSIEVTEPGVYQVKTLVGQCEVTREFIVTMVENTVIAIPNLITPNNDGVNDKWALPLKYLNDDTEVVVYAPDGSIVLKESHYNNNWPEADFTWSRKNSVYYYTIMEDNIITRRGSITIVK